MATVPREWVDNYVNSLSKVSDYMKRHLVLSLSSIDWDRPVAEVREELVVIFQVECRQGAGMASQLAANFYDGIRQWAIGERMGALVSSDYADEAMLEGAVHAIVDPLAKAAEDGIGEAAEKVVDDLCERIGMEVKRAAGETLFDNGKRDRRKPRFARVPRGSKSYPNGCPWCQMLASRGFVYLSEYEAGGDDPHHYHDGCRCAVVPSWDKSPSVEGFDPKVYEEGYQEWLDADHSEHAANKAMREGIRHGNLSPVSEPVTDVPAGLWGAINLAFNARFKGKRVGRIAFGDYLYTFRIEDYREYHYVRRRAIL